MATQNSVRIMGLWKQETRDGNRYLAGTLGGMRVCVFPNDRKETSKQPDYYVVASPHQPRENRERRGGYDNNYKNEPERSNQNREEF